MITTGIDVGSSAVKVAVVDDDRIIALHARMQFSLRDGSRGGAEIAEVRGMCISLLRVLRASA